VNKTITNTSSIKVNDKDYQHHIVTQTKTIINHNLKSKTEIFKDHLKNIVKNS